MKDISDFDYKKSLEEYVDKCNSGYTLNIQLEKIEILGSDGEKVSELNFGENDISHELAAIKNYDNWIIAGEDFINIVLYDEKKSIQEGKTIKLLSGTNGVITKSSEIMGIHLTNINKVFRKVDFSQQDSFEVSELLKEDVVIGELRDINPYNAESKDFDTEILDKYIYSSLLSLAHSKGVVLKYRTDDSRKIETIGDSELNVKLVNNIECVRYYLSAENTQQEHFKYVEYYHVLEYYFLYDAIKKIKKSIKEVVTANLVAEEWSDDKNYKFFMQLFNHYFDRKEENNELTQLKRIINDEIGFSLLTDIILKVNDKPKWLTNKLFDDIKTKVDISKIFNTYSNTYTLKESIGSLDKNNFCNEISQRIYAVRNYCVHSKKSEEIKLLVPTPENLNQLSNDILLVRSIAFALITIMQ